MKVIILGGSGTYGQIVSSLLVRSELVSTLVIAGRTLETTNSHASTLGSKAQGAQIDVLDETGLSQLLVGADLVINITGPEHRTILPALRASINAGVNYCDIGVDGGVAEAAFDLDSDAKSAGMTAMIGIGAAPGLFNMTALHALSCLDEPQAVHFAYCHKFESLMGSTTNHHERIQLGRKMLAVPEMFMHGLTGKARQYREGQLIDVNAYSDSRILPLFGEGAIEVYSFGSSEPITFSRAVPNIKNVTANIGFFPPELNDFMRQEIVNAGPQREEKAFRAIIEGIVNNPKLLTTTTREDVTCGEVVCIDGIKDGRAMRCIAEPSWNSGSFNPDAVTVDPLMVAVTSFLKGEVNTNGVISPEAWFDPQVFFEKLSAMTPIVSSETGSFVRTRLEPLV
jgi:saccharopine dehydrogenase-like NADP-dependent oxidoreductase